MSSKGMGSTSVRTLIEQLHTDVAILVLHDFDKSGFLIVGTLRRDTPRFKFQTRPRVFDLGLRLTDIKQMGLESERVAYDSDPTSNLRENGATEEEIEFLRGAPRGRGFLGQRVELNALTSDQFVEWLESKLKEHKITKIVPGRQTLEEAYRRAAAIAELNSTMNNALIRIEKETSALEVPADLEGYITAALMEQPSLSWDQVIERLVGDRWKWANAEYRGENFHRSIRLPSVAKEFIVQRVHRFSELSPARRVLLRLCQGMNFGQIQNLALQNGDPVFDPKPRLLIDEKLDSNDGLRREAELTDFELPAEVCRLIVRLDEIRNGVIERIEVRAGIPRRVVFESELLSFLRWK